MIKLVLSGGISLAVTYVLTFSLRAIGSRYDIVDVPTARSSHREPTVRIGGLAVFVGAVFGLVPGWPDPVSNVSARSANCGVYPACDAPAKRRMSSARGRARSLARKSPKKRRPIDIFKELVYIRDLIMHPNLTFEILMTREEVFRRQDPKRKRWKGWYVYDRGLVEVVERITLGSFRDFKNLLAVSNQIGLRSKMKSFFTFHLPGLPMIVNCS